MREQSCELPKGQSRNRLCGTSSLESFLETDVSVRRICLTRDLQGISLKQTCFLVGVLLCGSQVPRKTRSGEHSTKRSQLSGRSTHWWRTRELSDRCEKYSS